MSNLDISSSNYSDYSNDYILLLDSINFSHNDDKYPTLLMKSLRTRNLELAKVLIKSGVKLNEKNKCGCTALIFAVTFHYTEIVKDLLEYDANVNIVTKDSQNTALTIAIDKGYNDILALLLDAGANVNHQISNGYTALMMATVFGNEEAVQMLINAGADLNIKNRQGETALIIAIGDKNLNLVQLLVENGADINVKIGHLWWRVNAIELALETGCKEIYSYLIRYQREKFNQVSFIEIKEVKTMKEIKEI